VAPLPAKSGTSVCGSFSSFFLVSFFLSFFLVPHCVSSSFSRCFVRGSAAMAVDSGVQWVILGHSERRHVFGESNEVLVC
jgi:hypothetical protein